MAGRDQSNDDILSDFDPFTPTRGQASHHSSPDNENEHQESENFKQQYFMAAKEILALKQQLGQMKLKAMEEHEKAKRVPGGFEKIMPTKYSGSTDWDEYLVQFSYIAALHGWSNDRQAIILLGKLEGEALSVATSDKDMSLMALVARLKENFAPERKETFSLKLRTKVQGKEESFEELARDVKKLARKAYPTSDQDTREMLMVESFVNAINDDGLREKLRDRIPKTLNESLHEIRTLSENKELERNRRSKKCQNVSEKSGEEDLVSQVQEQLKVLQDELKQYKKGKTGNEGGQKRRDSGKRVPECYYCHLKGHIKRWCPLLQEGQPMMFNPQVPPPNFYQENWHGQVHSHAPANLSQKKQ